MSRTHNETEIKLRVAEIGAARRLLRREGFRVKKRRVFEENTVYDTPERQLRRQGMLLRLRRAGRACTLTFKGAAGPGKYKSREELELPIRDFAICQTILARLGFQPLFRYEKYRTEYAGASGKGVVTLDETPIGLFLEVEGPPHWIDLAARRLGYGEMDYITKSYGALYLDFCREKGIEPAHMLFR
jgi:adenylate cyclase class 2